MILSSRKTKVYLCKTPTDMRLGYDGLSLLVKKVFGCDPYGGQFFAFVNRRRTSCKIYTWDGTGTIVISKRLSLGTFCRPNPRYKKQLKLTATEFGQFFEGLNISGRILESIPNRAPNQRHLRFIPSYRKLSSYGGDGKGIQLAIEDLVAWYSAIQCP
jgi:transposase